ncbi:MAG: transcription-repair coupling factor [Clostridia bacterium]|nr:transcription-repair coupling factor [Clostridia bacterium]
MLGLCEGLRKLPELETLLKKIGEGTVTAVGGLSLPHKAHFIAAVRRFTGRPLVVLCADETACRRMAADVQALSGEDVLNLPYRECMFHNVESASREWELARLRAFHELSMGHAGIVVTTPDALLLRTMPEETLKAHTLRLKVGEQHELRELSARLNAAGYLRCDRVEGVGQYALRGGILDVFSPAYDSPVRVDFFDDEIDAMGLFDPESQRRTENIQSADILPAGEVLCDAAPDGKDGLIAKIRKLADAASRRKKAPEALEKNLRADAERLQEQGSLPSIDRYLELIYPDKTAAFAYLPDNAVWFLDDAGRVKERAKGFAWQMEEDIRSLLEAGTLGPDQTDLAWEYDELCAKLAARSTVLLETFISAQLDPKPKSLLTVMCKQLPSYGGSLETAVQDVEHYRRDGYTIILLAATERRAQGLQNMIDGSSLDYALGTLPPAGVVTIAVGNLSGGMEYPGVKLAVITEGQILAESTRKKKEKRKKSNREQIQSWQDLSVGDLIVHDLHGIGRFVGIEKIKTDNGVRDYIKLQYAGTDTLFVPASQLDTVSKYIGAGEDTPVKLHKLGGVEWQKTKTRAKAAAKDMAKKLIAIYAERKRRPGFKFPKDDDWQREFEDSFEYTETDAQLRSAAEIKSDMEGSAPMDRLLCGDVGFGKTEVAFRAVMKCILAGKQAAILVPTTVLARQHYLTAMRRFTGYPIKVALLSRFQNANESAEILRRLKEGRIDLIVGTHRLLSKNVVFHDLGLLIIDEEQRFGVTHKERLRDIARNIDTLTMTATPIPRTLNMALLGVRDMSTLEEAPRDRQPVQTYVLEYDLGVVCDAIRREVNRGGQVYFLHNRVETIDMAAAKLKAAMPELTYGVAHGQMDEKSLSEVMNGVSAGDIQVLVCTTIIETGIDIPNVNTLIIEDADRMGLAQLHQLRGRVGRSTRHAYAYLTYKKGKVLSEDSTKRLTAMREFAGFGAGFQIAMRDLEIRGAGNILGVEQSGHMIDVGYDMYLRLLEEAVLEERGEKAQKKVDCTAELAVNAHIPENYVPVSEERMDLYRRIAFIKEPGDVDDVIDELCDRYGDPPKSVQNLVEIALLRADASRADITEITQKDHSILLGIPQPDFERVANLCSTPGFKGRIMLSAGDKPYLTLKLKAGEDPIATVKAMIAAYTAVKPSVKPAQ